MELYPNSHGQPVPPGTPKPVYELTRDPLFFGTILFFALITTALPAMMGQPNFMPVLQALGLTIFTAIGLRRGGVGPALGVAALWLTGQLIFLCLLAWLLPASVEKAIHAGFLYRTGLSEWAYAGNILPEGMLAAPLARLGEIAGVVLGSLATVGLLGGWFLVKGVNLLAFGMGSLWREIGSPLGLLLGLAPWRLAQLAGYTGLFVLLTQPLLLNDWNPAHYLSTQRRLILISLALLAGGLLAELFLPGLWRALFAPA
ncbi:MAG TPA: hypothetical protein PL105_09420 [Caldilineaceae bacterium]|nr:hypothetical protein [Caldilineaceae bacterium]